MRKSLALTVAAVSIAGVGALAPVAANAADQTVTFTVGTPGLLTIANAAGTTVLTGGPVMSGAIPLTTVTDTYTTGAGWTVSASATDFTLSGVTPSAASTIAATKATLETDTPVVAVPGTATVTDAHDTSVVGNSALALSNSPASLMTATTTNANTVTYNATVKVDTTGAANGLYTGTVTQTVA
jgi:hypothetical protein